MEAEDRADLGENTFDKYLRRKKGKSRSQASKPIIGAKAWSAGNEVAIFNGHEDMTSDNADAGPEAQ